MPERPGQPAHGGDRFAWIDPGVSVWDQWGATPPPPKVGPSTAGRASASPASTTATPVERPAEKPSTPPAYTGDPEPLPEPDSDFVPPPRERGVADRADTPGVPPSFYEFDAELDVAELDDRLRPVTTWSARALSVNRSSLGFRSRRMCYAKRILMIAVHLIDDKPVILAGRVTKCDYDGEAMYVVEVELMTKPVSEEIRHWEAQR